jgi:hypothetical protein
MLDASESFLEDFETFRDLVFEIDLFLHFK